jgi:predicted RND superfamily exporter protein
MTTGNETRPLGALVSDLLNDLSRLIREELQLARTEMRQSVREARSAAVTSAVAGLAGFFVLLFASWALVQALDEWMPTGWATLLVAGIWLAVAVVAALMARQAWQQVDPVPHQTIETLKEDTWNRGQTS